MVSTPNEQKYHLVNLDKNNDFNDFQNQFLGRKPLADIDGVK